MKTNIQNLPHLARLAVLVLLSTLNLQLSTFAQDTLITYQGRLNDNGNPANGLYDLRFSLYDNSSGGLPVGNNVIQTAPVTNGLFTASINFGAGFAGANRWLQLEVRTNGSGAGYTVLDPRQRVTAAPYSIYALAAATAATAGSASNVVSGSVVSSVNALKDNVILQAGSNVTISPSGNTLTIASAGVGGAASGRSSTTMPTTTRATWGSARPRHPFTDTAARGEFWRSITTGPPCTRNLISCSTPG